MSWDVGGLLRLLAGDSGHSRLVSLHVRPRFLLSFCYNSLYV